MENASAAFPEAIRSVLGPIRRALGAGAVDPDLLSAAEHLQYGGYLRRREQNGAIRAADQSAVSAALSEPWSDGSTEGLITKLKPIRRRMYGRGKLDLLRAKLVARTESAYRHAISDRTLLPRRSKESAWSTSMSLRCTRRSGVGSSRRWGAPPTAPDRTAARPGGVVAYARDRAESLFSAPEADSPASSSRHRRPRLERRLEPAAAARQRPSRAASW